MPFNDANPGDGLNSGLDASGLSADLSKAEQELLGHTVNRHPTALGKVSGSLTDGDDGSFAASGDIDNLTGLPRSPFLGDSPLYGDEFESGILPIDYGAYQIRKAWQKINIAVEAGKPVIERAAEEVASQVVQELRQNVQSLQDDWKAPDNELRHFVEGIVEEKAPHLLQRVKQLWKDVAANPRVQGIAETVVELGKNFQHHTEQWSDRLFEETYVGSTKSHSQPQRVQGHRQAQHALEDSPFVGVIDTRFTKNSHGTQVAQIIEREGQQSPDWYGGGVGSGDWADTLVKFVDAVKSSGKTQAVVNLSFDLTQINPDGSVTTRHELTSEEYAALSYAQDNRVLLVVSAGNQGSEMSALGKASQTFDNIIAVGAVEKGQRADYSSYGDGVDFVASGQGRGDVEGTSLSAARVTGAIAQIWKANPDLSYQQVIQVLEEGATDLQETGVDPYTGVGEPDVELSVELADGYVGEGDRPDGQEPPITQSTQLFDEDALIIAGERPAFLGGLKDAVRSGWNTLEENVVEPIVEKLPTRIQEPVRSAGSTLKEAVQDIASDPGNTPEIIRNTISDLSTAAEGVTYPGYTFEYESGTLPVYDPKVEQWQERMRERGWRISVDGYYGAHSAEVARQFQEEKRLPADGIVGPQTWAAAFSTRNEEPSSQIARGELPAGVSGTDGESSRVFSYEPGQPLTYNPNVERWQQRMRHRGWNIAVDGFYGAHSAEVARQFQEEKKLVADGIVGERTWEESFRTDNITSSSSGASIGSGLSASYGEPVSNATPDSRYSQYSGQITENSGLSDNMRAFLDTISYAEGTYAPDGYRIRFGGDRFDSFTDHPRIHEPFRDTTSTAAGRYQFIQKTWDGVRSQLGLSDFSPQSQDLAAVQLIKNRGAYKDIEAGRFETAVAKVAKEWASFPGAGYNQPEKNLANLKEFYEASLQRYQDGSSTEISSEVDFSYQDTAIGSSGETFQIDFQLNDDEEITEDNPEITNPLQVYPPGFIGPVGPNAVVATFKDWSLQESIHGSKDETWQLATLDADNLPEHTRDRYQRAMQGDKWARIQLRLDPNFPPPSLYKGGGFITAPDGKEYPIIYPLVSQNGQLYTEEGEGTTPPEQQQISTLLGRDTGWKQIMRIEGIEQMGEVSQATKNLVRFTPVDPSFKVGSLPASEYTKLSIDGVPLLTDKPVGPRRNLDPSPAPGNYDLSLYRTHDGKLVATDYGSLNPREKSLNQPPPIEKWRKWSVRGSSAADLSVMIAVGMANAARLDDTTLVRYEVNFEQHADGRRRAIINAFHMTRPLIGDNVHSDKIFIYPFHFYQNEAGQLAADIIRYRYNRNSAEFTAPPKAIVYRPPDTTTS